MESIPSFPNSKYSNQSAPKPLLIWKLKLTISTERSNSMKAILKITIKKTSIKNKSKPTKKSTLVNGKKESKSLPKSTLTSLPKSTSKTENLKPMKSSNGSLSPFMASLTVNFTGLISRNKSLKEMKEKTSEKDWVRLTPAMQGNNKE